ncbi:hypothetical protein, partial [Ferrimicrobium acidiphilum]|uniref:hypothetical protein n=1 Tax=Ferrimicrobium acidiphilum TaxID=121039 RepID=UPI0023F30990
TAASGIVSLPRRAAVKVILSMNTIFTRYSRLDLKRSLLLHHGNELPTGSTTSNGIRHNMSVHDC